MKPFTALRAAAVIGAVLMLWIAPLATHADVQKFEDSPLYGKRRPVYGRDEYHMYHYDVKDGGIARALSAEPSSSPPGYGFDTNRGYGYDNIARALGEESSNILSASPKYGKGLPAESTEILTGVAELKGSNSDGPEARVTSPKGEIIEGRADFGEFKINGGPRVMPVILERSPHVLPSKKERDGIF